MDRVITYGTFDLFHYGHLSFLRRARLLGDHLTVGLSTDIFNQTKGKTSHFTYKERKRMLEGIRYVDEIIPEECWEQKVTDIPKLGIQIFTIGDDWLGKFDFLKPMCQVVYLSRTPDISSTLLKGVVL